MYLCRANASDAVLQMFPGDARKQGMVLTAFYCGYLLQFVYGPLVECFGAKYVLSCAVASYGLFTLMLGQFGASLAAAIGLRAMVGLAQGATYPSQCRLTAYWYPSQEWNLAWTLTSGGESLGTIAMLGLGPVLEHHFSWHSLFWISGACAIMWALLFAYFGADEPESPNSGVCAAELEYILANRRPIDSSKHVPWRQILCCRPFWGTVVSHVCYNYGFFVALGWLPSYFADAFHVNYSQMGLFTMLPYFTLLFCATGSGAIADYFVSRGCSLLSVRKTMNTIGFLGPAVCFYLLRFCRTSGSVHTAVALASLAVGLSGVAFAGYWASFCDLSPRFSCHLLAISNSIASLPGIVGNVVTGTLLAGSSNDYDKVFSIACGVYVVGALVFLLLAEAKPQF